MHDWEFLWYRDGVTIAAINRPMAAFWPPTRIYVLTFGNKRLMDVEIR
ncbi:hypothetical protein RRSWK_06577 [Rhodopirellula sp. SWK7]|nr:hypothetical protein RRSWK_06577 [Rhodopirellula sp. SWK7]